MIIPLMKTEADYNLIAYLLKCLNLGLTPSYNLTEYGIEIYRNDTHELIVNFVKSELIIKKLEN